VTVLIDTNVLVYRFDNRSPEKQRIARDRYIALVRAGEAIISTQVLQEFYWVTTRKLARPLNPADARAVVVALSKLPLVATTPQLLLAAIDKSERYAMAFWDALILEAALAGGADTLLTEDLQHGATIAGVRIENPFLSAA